MVLVGLKEGVTVTIEERGVNISDPGLRITLANLGIQRVEPTFPGMERVLDGDPTEATTGSATGGGPVYRPYLGLNADITHGVLVSTTQPGIAYAKPDGLMHSSPRRRMRSMLRNQG